MQNEGSGNMGRRIEKITREETRFEVPPIGGTFIVVLRNGDDYRAKPKQMAEADKVEGGLEFGELMPSSATEARIFARQELEKLLATLTPEEIKQLDIFVVASDSKIGTLATPDGSIPPPNQRCVETGNFFLAGIQEAMAKHSIDNSQLLNRNFPYTAASPHSVILKRIEDIQMRENTEAYFAFLKEQETSLKASGKKANMWAMYEEDVFKEKRLELGVEGPEEIAIRMQKFVERAQSLSAVQHKEKPGRRLLVLAVLPRDVVGPWLNTHISGLTPHGYEIPTIDPLAGFGIAISPVGELEVKIAGQEDSLKTK